MTRMYDFTMQLNSPITEEQWNTITDAELEHSQEIEFTTPSGKKVLFQKVRRGRWIEHINTMMPDLRGYVCSECNTGNVAPSVIPFNEWVAAYKYCPNCGAKMEDKA